MNAPDRTTIIHDKNDRHSGMLLDLAIGGQKFIFKPAGELGKAKTAEAGAEQKEGGGETEKEVVVEAKGEKVGQRLATDFTDGHGFARIMRMHGSFDSASLRSG